MISVAIKDTYQFLSQNDLKTIFARIRDRNIPWLLQFFIYGLCGLLATVLSVGQVVLLSKTIIPAYENMVVNGEAISDALRSRNLLINNTIAFLTTNVFVYFMNILLVFKRGKHHPVVEFLFFTMVNSISFLLSQFAGPWLVHQYGISTNVAILTNTVFSTLINFIARKFFVFKG